jgi:hypothetical protein
MHSSILLILMFCASVCWSNAVFSLPADTPTEEFKANAHALNEPSYKALQSDEKKDKKKPKQTTKTAKKKSNESEKESNQSKAEIKEGSDKTPETVAKKEVAKKEEGLSWAVVMVIAVVSIGAGAGIVLLLMRRKSETTTSAAKPKALLGSADAEVIVVESRVLRQEPTSEETAVRKEMTREPTPVVSEFRTEQSNEPSLLQKSAPVQPAPTPLPTRQTPPAQTAMGERVLTPEKPAADKKENAPEKVETTAKNVKPEEPDTVRTSETDTTSMLLDDNSIDLRENGTSNKDFALLNELTQKPETEHSEELISDQLILPEDEDLLIDSDSMTAKEVSLLKIYQSISTPEEESEFMSKVWIGTISNFEEVFGNPTVKPIFIENSEGSFFISKQVTKDEEAEVFILRNFPVHDFLMRESLKPAFDIQCSDALTTGFAMKLPARVKKGELGWQLVSKGEILIPA